MILSNKDKMFQDKKIFIYWQAQNPRWQALTKLKQLNWKKVSIIITWLKWILEQNLLGVVAGVGRHAKHGFWKFILLFWIDSYGPLWESGGFWVGKGGGEFNQWRNLDVPLPCNSPLCALQLCPSGPTAKCAIDARNDMSCLRHSPGPIVTPRRIIGRSND